MATREVKVELVREVLQLATKLHPEMHMDAAAQLTRLTEKQYDEAWKKYNSASLFQRLVVMNKPNDIIEWADAFPKSFAEWKVSQVKAWWRHWNGHKWENFEYRMALPDHPYSILEKHSKSLTRISDAASNDRGLSLMRLDHDEWRAIEETASALEKWQSNNQ